MNGQFDSAANANYNNSSSNNPYVQYSPVPMTNSATKRQYFLLLLLPCFLLANFFAWSLLDGAGPMDNMLESLSQCGKRVEVATKRAEAIADSVWHHRKFLSSKNPKFFPMQRNSVVMLHIYFDQDHLGLF